MSLEQELVELKDALRSMIEILRREGWPSVSGWEATRDDVDAILAGEFAPEEITSWARSASSRFGVGMGSLSDVYLGDDFETAREDVGNRFGRIGRHAREAPEFVPRIRRHLTALEDRLLEACMPSDAAKLRQILSGGSLDLAVAKQIVEDLVQRVSSLPQSVTPALAEARAEVAAANNPRRPEGG